MGVFIGMPVGGRGDAYQNADRVPTGSGRDTYRDANRIGGRDTYRDAHGDACRKKVVCP